MQTSETLPAIGCGHAQRQAGAEGIHAEGAEEYSDLKSNIF